PACALLPSTFSYFHFTATSPPESYTLSLHDALPISLLSGLEPSDECPGVQPVSSAALSAFAEPPGCHPSAGDSDPRAVLDAAAQDRKSTRLNSSHLVISYAVFCLKKKKQTYIHLPLH